MSTFCNEFSIYDNFDLKKSTYNEGVAVRRFFILRTLIYGGRLIDPANRVDAYLSLLIENGRVAYITESMPEADERIDAAGKIVCPGFIDIHMHEDPVENGRIYADADRAIFSCMLRMGVTTAIGGNCGDNCCDPADYLDIVDRNGAAVNVGMLAGHTYFRRCAGVADRYLPATCMQRMKIREGIERALARGCLGVSYGLRYSPGTDHEEILAAARPCCESNKMIAAHIRSDAQEVFAAGREILDAGMELGIPVQLSHIGSMAGFGQMESFLRMVDLYRMNGLDVSCDCYPYEAFSTSIGSATYDDGWMERYGCSYDAVELCEGKYKGQRCTESVFNEVRRAHPECLTVCYVMREADVDRAFFHPNVMLASDGILSHGQGHPRAAGAFPRFLAQFVRRGKIGIYDAISKMTAMPADLLGLLSKGRLSIGSDADIVIFSPEHITDCADFQHPVRVPKGIDRVLIGGVTAAEQGRIVKSDLGRSLRK